MHYHISLHFQLLVFDRHANCPYLSIWWTRCALCAMTVLGTPSMEGELACLCVPHFSNCLRTNELLLTPFLLLSSSSRPPCPPLPPGLLSDDDEMVAVRTSGWHNVGRS